MAEPITTAELKEHLRIAHAELDTYIDTLISAAREEVERDTWRALIAAEKTIYLRGFPSRRNGDAKIYLPFTPLRAVTSIDYIDAAGDPQTLAEANYVVDTSKEPGTIEPAYGLSWPTTRDGPAAVTIVFDAGYATPGDVPPSLAHAVKLIAAELFDNATPSPLSQAGGGTGTVRTTLDRFLEKYRVRCDAILESV